MRVSQSSGFGLRDSSISTVTSKVSTGASKKMYRSRLFSKKESIPCVENEGDADEGVPVIGREETRAHGEVPDQHVQHLRES